MARISHRTPEYNMAAGHLHLQATFATTHSFTEYVNTPSYWHVGTPADRITRFYKETHTAVESAMLIFCRHRTWYKREMFRATLHPTIKKMLDTPEQAQYLTDWREMVLEYPHIADTDATKISFTENEAKGLADRQTVTTLGKYIKRHAPDMPDHVLRDIVMLSVAAVVLVHDLPSMIDAVQNGPRSCMQNSFNVHPYSVYDPQYGWHMAVRREGGDIVGRCLCLTHGGEKLFVRSYRRHENGYSQSDEGLNAWLEERGYSHWGEWPQGVRLAKIWDGGDLVLPYIDGGSTRCAEHVGYLTIDDDGDYDGCMQGGFADVTSRSYCDDCGNSYDPDDGISTGRHEDNHVCDDCSSAYTYVYGRYGNQYYISDDDVVNVCGEAYDQDYLRDNNIVFCEHDGDYHSLDDCYELDVSGDYVHRDDCYDDTIVCLDDDNVIFAYKSDCWQCAGTELWYSSDTRSDYYAQSWTGADGRLYHEDQLPDAVEEADRTFSYDSVCLALFHGVELHCHHVTQFIDKLYA